jgi:ADP-ribose pyrophosphatase YjhB (NUDIX family)
MDSKNFYANLPKKRMGAGVLFLNKKGEVLILKTNYKRTWTIPGGMVEKDESPRQTAIRETKEETGLKIFNPEFLCVDYNSDYEEKGESLQFVFYGGILNQKQINGLKIPNDEINEYKFAKIEEAVKLLSKRFKRRLPNCVKAFKKQKPVYLEEGKNK